MKKILILLVVLSTIIANAQNPLPAGTVKLILNGEFGGKGIKLNVLAYTNSTFRKYVPVDNKEINIGLSQSFQSTGTIPKDLISSAVSSTYDAYTQLFERYKSSGLTTNDVYFYTSSGVGVATNVQELCDAFRNKTGFNVKVVTDVEEAKYTIAGTIPYEKIDNAFVFDIGGSNSKGGYVIKEGNFLTAVPVVFDLGSVRVSELVTKYMRTLPDEQEEYNKEYIFAMNKCFDSLKQVIKRTLSNIEGAEDRNELYLSGGASFVMATLLKPESDSKTQMVELNIQELRAFVNNIQSVEFYNELKNKVFADEKVSKTYKSSFKIYTHTQLMSASKLVMTYVNSLSGSNKKIFFNRYGLHAMPSMLVGRVLRGEITKW